MNDNTDNTNKTAFLLIIIHVYVHLYNIYRDICWKKKKDFELGILIFFFFHKDFEKKDPWISIISFIV